MYIQLLLAIQLTSVLSVPAPKLNSIRKSVVPLIRNSIQSTSNTIQSKLQAQEEIEQEQEQEQVKVEGKKETSPSTFTTTCPKGEKLVALQNENAKINYQCQKVEEENTPCSSNSILQAKRNKEGLIEYNCIQLNSINQDSNPCPMGMVLTAFQNGYRCVGYNSREIDSSSVESKQVSLNDQEVIPKCNETSVLTRTESGLNCTPLNDKKVEDKVGKKPSGNEDSEKKKSNESKNISSNKDEDEDEDDEDNDKEEVKKEAKKEVTKPKKDLNEENSISNSESKSQLKPKSNITSKDTKLESKLIKPKPSNPSKDDEENEENDENKENDQKVKNPDSNKKLPFKVKITHPKVQIFNNDLDEGMIRKTTLITKKWVA